MFWDKKKLYFYLVDHLFFSITFFVSIHMVQCLQDKTLDLFTFFLYALKYMVPLHKFITNFTVYCIMSKNEMG